MYETIDEHLRSNFYNNETIGQMLQDFEHLLLEDKISSFVAANKMLDTYFSKM